jgi:hypothetical protein
VFTVSTNNFFPKKFCSNQIQQQQPNEHYNYFLLTVTTAVLFLVL